jgi:hypothetical protein
MSSGSCEELRSDSQLLAASECPELWCRLGGAAWAESQGPELDPQAAWPQLVGSGQLRDRLVFRHDVMYITFLERANLVKARDAKSRA